MLEVVLTFHVYWADGRVTQESRRLKPPVTVAQCLERAPELARYRLAFMQYNGKAVVDVVGRCEKILGV